jgi:hypothetical protein
MTINAIKKFGSDLIEDVGGVAKSLSSKNERTSTSMLASSVALRTIGVLSALYGTSFLAKSLLGFVSLNPFSSIVANLFLITSIALFITAHESIKIGYNLRNIASDVQGIESDGIVNQAFGMIKLAFKKAREQVNKTPAIFEGTLIAEAMKHIESLSRKVNAMFAS